MTDAASSETTQPVDLPEYGAWVAAPLVMIAAWALGLAALILQANLGWMALLPLLPAAALAVLWRKRRARLRPPTAPPDTDPAAQRKETWRARAVLAAVAAGHVALLFAGHAALLDGGILPLVFLLVVVLPAGVWALQFFLVRRRPRDLWALCLFAVVACALPATIWLTAAGNWSLEPGRAHLYALAFLALPLYGALWRPRHEFHDSLGAAVPSAILLSAVVVLGLLAHTVHARQTSSSVCAWEAPASDLLPGRGTVEARRDEDRPAARRGPPADELLRSRHWARSQFVPLTWTAGADAASVSLRYLDLRSDGGERELVLATGGVPDPVRPPRFSPRGAYIAVALRAAGAEPSMEVFERATGRRVFAAGGWLPKTGPAWGAHEDAVVIETPGEVARVALPGGERMAVAQRGRPGMPPLVYYGCDRGGRLVMGPPLPARRPVIRLYRRGGAPQRIELRDEQASALWISERHDIAAYPHPDGRVSFCRLWIENPHEGVEVDGNALSRHLGPYPLNLPDEALRAGIEYVPAGANPWREQGDEELVFAVNARGAGRAFYFLLRFALDGLNLNIIRQDLPGPVASDLVTGNSGIEFAARPQDAAGGLVWYGYVGSAGVRRVRVPLRGAGRLVWPRDAPRFRYLRLPRDARGRLQVFAPDTPDLPERFLR